MSNTTFTTGQPEAETATEAAEPIVETRDVIEADDLVEEISIDGMCGVY